MSLKPAALNRPRKSEFSVTVPTSGLMNTLVDHHGIAALLVDINTMHILWSSRASETLNAGLKTGTHLGAVPELFAVLCEPVKYYRNTIRQQSEEFEVRVLARCSVQPSPVRAQDDHLQNKEIASPKQHAGLQDGHVADERVNICLWAIGCQDDGLLLQIEREQYLDNYYRQYVAEREKLFNTSRALTVNEMATTLAHELNQPIGTVVNLLHGCLERLQIFNAEGPEQVGARVDADVLEALDFAIRQSRFASQIISRVREFTEARQPSIERMDIRELLQESVQLLDWVFATEGINLSMRAGQAELLVDCDRMLLQQVFVNLCRNAIEAMRGMPQSQRVLNVESYRSDDGVHVDIMDSGPGMTDDAMSAMFTPFVSSKRDGMGVGLNICRSFIELHQGRLWIKDNAQGGCTVHIRLPDVRAIEGTAAPGGRH